MGGDATTDAGLLAYGKMDSRTSLGRSQAHCEWEMSDYRESRQKPGLMTRAFRPPLRSQPLLGSRQAGFVATRQKKEPSDGSH